MGEVLYTIPVKDAYKLDCECPVCKMYNDIEKNAIEFTMGPSYMEDDIRAVTDEKGFCKEHTQKLMDANNRLGMGLILRTHFAKTNADIKKLTASGGKSGLFKKKDISELTNYIHKLNSSCFVCDKITFTFERYLKTIIHLWKKDSEFRVDYKNSKGMCNQHYVDLLEYAQKSMHGSDLDTFIDETNELYIKNMERLYEDLDWFVKKFDYKYKDEPWKNARDSVFRANNKTVGIIPPEDESPDKTN